MKLTYKQAYDKIIEAYFKDEIKPLNSRFCFCGTLSPTQEQWNQSEGFSWGQIKEEYLTHQYDHPQPYSLLEYKRMEWALFYGKSYLDKNIEDDLFSGMCAALEVLKEIHRARGENVDGLPVFTKRELLNQ